jgi:hypothetical protein
MKKFWAAVAIIAVVAGIYFFEKQKIPAPEKKEVSGQISDAGLFPNPPPFETNSENARPTSSSGAKPALPNDLASRAASPNSIVATNEIANLPPPTVLDKARVAIHNYNSAFGENPVGTNPEITAALMGKNPKQINFITSESGLRVNENGEMVDAYGTPFFFHQLSGQEMEIRSAGEDRKMWTFDDQVTR